MSPGATNGSMRRSHTHIVALSTVKYQTPRCVRGTRAYVMPSRRNVHWIISGGHTNLGRCGVLAADNLIVLYIYGLHGTKWDQGDSGTPTAPAEGCLYFCATMWEQGVKQDGPAARSKVTNGNRVPGGRKQTCNNNKKIALHVYTCRLSVGGVHDIGCQPANMSCCGRSYRIKETYIPSWRVYSVSDSGESIMMMMMICRSVLVALFLSFVF